MKPTILHKLHVEHSIHLPRLKAVKSLLRAQILDGQLGLNLEDQTVTICTCQSNCAKCYSCGSSGIRIEPKTTNPLFQDPGILAAPPPVPVNLFVLLYLFYFVVFVQHITSVSAVLPC